MVLSYTMQAIDFAGLSNEMHCEFIIEKGIKLVVHLTLKPA